MEKKPVCGAIAKFCDNYYTIPIFKHCMRKATSSVTLLMAAGRKIVLQPLPVVRVYWINANLVIEITLWWYAFDLLYTHVYLWFVSC